LDGVPSHKGIQDDADTAPFHESDEMLGETAGYLVDLDKYTRRLENEALTLFSEIKDATGAACLHLPCCLQLERENSALRYCVRELEQGLGCANATLLQSERERVDTREELLHVKEDLRQITVSQSQLIDKLQSKDNLLTVCAHRLSR
jgi:hypothetical protein